MVAIGGVLNGCGRLPIFADAGSVGTGGSTPAGGATGTAGASGTGGASGAGNTGGSGGNAGGGTGGSAPTPGFGEPACPPGVVRLSPCTPADLQLCYTRCGPEDLGVNAHMCRLNGQQNGAYDGMSGCTLFDPFADYSCYKIPTAANAACPQDVTPQVGMSCQVAHCVLCNSTGGLPGGGWLDASGAPRFTGWCVCQPPNAAGARSWSCAPDTNWPCPAGTGC